MTATGTELRIREAAPADEPFLWRMLARAVALPPTVPPPVEEVREDPGLAGYLEGWGRDGDVGLIAEADGTPVGAAWYRLFPAERPAYGFVADDVPEIGLAVDEGWRGRGVGRSLLTALAARARQEGRGGLSLSVDSRNAAAIGLYRSMGFQVVGGDAGHPTMLLRLVG